MKLKYLLFLCLCVILLFTIFGCTKKTDNTANIDTSKASTDPDGIVPKVTIGTSDKTKLGRSITISTKIENEGAVDTNDIIIARVSSCGAIRNSEGNNYVSQEFTKEEVPKNKGAFGEIVLSGLTASAVTKQCNIYADVCYTYLTKLTYEVSLGSTKKEYSSEKIPAQGSPINIISITRDVYEGLEGQKRIEFRMGYENKGGGTVVRADQYDKKCTSGLKDEDLSMLDVFAAEVYLSDDRLDCYFENKITDFFRINYKDKTKNYIICAIPDNIVTPAMYKEESIEKRMLTITLNYGYYKRVSKNVVIES